MINSRMKSYIVQKKGSETDIYGQPSTTFTTLKTIEASISLMTETLNKEDARYVQSTHIALTFDKSLTDGLRITDNVDTYLIKLVNNDGRMAQLTLQKEVL